MAASAAHELGTPLATMKLLVDELQSQPQTAEVAEDLALFNQQIECCKTILLRLTEVGGWQRANASHAQTASKWLEDVLGTLQSHRLDLVIRRDFAELTSSIVTDTSLDQALNNLINNAARAAPGKAVEIKVRERGRMLELEIADRGNGMPAKVLNTLNTPAIRQRLPTEGLGIGLMLSVTSIEQHGGSLEYMSRPGGGTIARVTLPFHDR